MSIKYNENGLLSSEDARFDYIVEHRDIFSGSFESKRVQNLGCKTSETRFDGLDLTVQREVFRGCYRVWYPLFALCFI